MSKGTVNDLPIMMIVGLLLALILGIVFFVGSNLFDKFGELPVVAGNEVANETIGKVNTAERALNVSVPILIILMGITSIILAFMIPAHPIFAPISTILLIFYVVISTIFSNIFQAFAEDSPFTSIFNSLPLTVFIFENLPWIIGTLGVIIIVVQHSRSRRFQ